MNRRDLLAAVPAATLATPLLAQATTAPGTPNVEGKPLGFQAPDAPRFDRPDVHAGDRVVGASFASRSAVYGRSGAAGSAHPLATQIAIEILRKGGSAVDATIALNAALGFLEPTSSGLGGDCYALLWDPKAAKVVAFAGSGASPRALTLAIARSRARTDALPPLGAIAVSVPGVCDAWWQLHQRYGRLKWAEVLAPAIAIAEEGVPVPPVIATYMRSNLKAFTRSGSGVEETANALRVYAPGGEGPAVGAVFRNPDLAATYRLIADGGRDAFYEGPIAREIDAYFKRIGGWMTRADLAAHHGEWIEPLFTTYRGIGIHAMSANTQGLATIQMLNMLEQFDLRGAGFQSPLSLHLQVAAKRLAFEDRARYYADPHFAKVPIRWLASKEYAAERAKLIRPDRILDPVYPGEAPNHGDTTYFCAADRDGMMVSMIQSNFRGMGSGLVADGPGGRTLGFMFQDRGQLFSLKDGHPNIYAPGKRPFQTIIPGFATKDGQPWLAFGVMSGDMQPQGQTQILLNRIDYGLDAQAAGDSPRWHHEGSSQSMGEDPPGLPKTGLLRLETGVPDATKAALAGMGYMIGKPDGGFGRYECVERTMPGGERVYVGASEMRADGCALAY